MANNVNPPVAVLGRINKGSIQYFTAMERILDQLWVRSGGSDDSTSSLETEVNAQDSRKIVEIRQLTKKLAYTITEMETIKTMLYQVKEEIRQNSKLNEQDLSINARIKKIESKLKELELS